MDRTGERYVWTNKVGLAWAWNGVKGVKGEWVEARDLVTGSRD